MDLVEPMIIRHSIINDRKVWEHEIRTTIGDLYIVQHEQPDLVIVDDYIGWSEQKADKTYMRIVTKIAKEA